MSLSLLLERGQGTSPGAGCISSQEIQGTAGPRTELLGSLLPIDLSEVLAHRNSECSKSESCVQEPKYPEHFEPEILSNDPSFPGEYASLSTPGGRKRYQLRIPKPLRRSSTDLGSQNNKSVCHINLLPAKSQ